MSDRDFKGIWIPRNVWLDNRLNALDKIILAEIDSLDSQDRGCYASNKHIAEFCQCSETKVSTAITKLIKIGYIYQSGFNGRQRELKSRLSQPVSPIEPHTLPKKENKTKNYSNEYKIIIDHLNAIAGTRYKVTSKATQSHINARLNEGFSVEDFIAVIDAKCAEWKGTKFEQYLRPETLFGTKFESYLNTPKPKTNVNNSGLNDYKKGVDYF